MAEIGPNETLHYLSRLVVTSLDQTEEFWKTLGPESKLAPMLEPTGKRTANVKSEYSSICFRGDDTVDINQRFRNLVILHIRVTVIADVFSTTGYAHGRSAISLLQTLMADPPKVVPDMGTLHRAFIWENILFKTHIASRGIELGISGGVSPLERSPSHVSVSLPESGASGAVANGVQAESTTTGSSNSVAQLKETPRDKNAKALKHLTHGLPSALAPFFQGKAHLQINKTCRLIYF